MRDRPNLPQVAKRGHQGHLLSRDAVVQRHRRRPGDTHETMDQSWPRRDDGRCLFQNRPHLRSRIFVVFNPLDIVLRDAMPGVVILAERAVKVKVGHVDYIFHIICLGEVFVAAIVTAVWLSSSLF